MNPKEKYTMTLEEDTKTKPKSEMDKLEPKANIFEPEMSKLKTNLDKVGKLMSINLALSIIILCLVCYKLGRDHGKAISESQVSFNPITYLIT